LSKEEPKYVEIDLSPEILNKLDKERDELIEKGAKLQNGEPVKTINDVLTYMLDRYDAYKAQAKAEQKIAEQPKRKEGWWKPELSRKFHYFVDDRSLCRGWLLPNYLEMQEDTGNKEPGKEDCAGCFRKLVKRRQDLGVDKIV